MMKFVKMPGVRRRMNERGVSLMEYGILAGLIAATGVGTVLATGGEISSLFSRAGSGMKQGREVALNGPQGEMAGLSCLDGTNGPDTISLSDMGAHDCVNAMAGDDNIDISGLGFATIFPGAGSDIVRNSGAGVSVYYSSGNDDFTNGGADGLLDLSGVSMAASTWGVPAGSGFVRDVLLDVPGPWTLTLTDQVVTAANNGFETVRFADGTMTYDEIHQAALASQWTTGNDNIRGTQRDDVIYGLAGNDSIETFEGDDVVYYESGNDTIDVKTGYDILHMDGYLSTEMYLDIKNWQGELRMITNGGAGSSIYVPQQFRYSGASQQRVAEFIFSDATVADDDMRLAALAQQEVREDATYMGTGRADVMTPRGGNDDVRPFAGDDTIIYQAAAGGMTIMGDPDTNERNSGFDTLDLSIYNQADVAASYSGADVYLTTPAGVITLNNQVKYALGGTTNLNIDEVVFADGSWDEAAIRTAAGAP